MSDWWTKKLAGEKPSPEPMQMVPAQYSNRPVPPQEQPAQRVLNEQASPTAQIGMGVAIRSWKGGEAHQREGGNRCPSCGSANVFSRTGRGSNSMINGAAPAPHCFECGWNGKYEQASQSLWAG